MRQVVRSTIQTFCCEFVRNPYLCYTEHGQHAIFFAQLLAAIPESLKYRTWRGERVCIVQKEYPTAASLGKPKRQHWDIAVLKDPLSSKVGIEPGYDFLKLEVVVEFGMNEAIAHLVDDVDRIAHLGSNVEYGFVVHLNRLSDARARFSGRDWSPRSRRIAPVDALRDVARGKAVEIWYAIADQTFTHQAGVWQIPPDGPAQKVACA